MKGTYGTKAYCNESIALNYHNTNDVFSIIMQAYLYVDDLNSFEMSPFDERGLFNYNELKPKERTSILKVMVETFSQSNYKMTIILFRHKLMLRNRLSI